MIRAFSLAAVLAAALAAPAFAADTKTTDEAGAAPAATSTHTGNFFTEVQARQHLMHLGYTNISELSRRTTTASGLAPRPRTARQSPSQSMSRAIRSRTKRPSPDALSSSARFATDAVLYAKKRRCLPRPAVHATPAATN